MIVVGVDVSLRRGLDIVAIDADPRRPHRRIVSPTPVARASHDSLQEMLEELRPAAVAIDGPPAFGTPPARTRLAERQLRELGIIAFSTPSDPAVFGHPFYLWMHEAQAAFAAAGRAGYPVYGGSGPVRGAALEVFPHGTAVALTGALPPPGCSRSATDKRRWRAEALAGAGVDVSTLTTTDAVDAGLAAVTAAAALAGEFYVVGGRVEGDRVEGGRVEGDRVEGDRVVGDGAVVLPGTRPPGAYPRASR